MNYKKLQKTKEEMRHTVYHKILDSTLTLPTSSLRLKDEDPRLTAKFLHPWERKSDKNYAVWQPNYWGCGVWGAWRGICKVVFWVFKKFSLGEPNSELGWHSLLHNTLKRTIIRIWICCSSFVRAAFALRTKVNIVGGRSDGNLSSAD